MKKTDLLQTPFLSSLAVAPCLAHPCDSPGNNPCKTTCAFSRNNISQKESVPLELQTIIPAEEYGCTIKSTIKVAKNGALFMVVGEKIFPSQNRVHPQVIAAQNRLSEYLDKR